MKEFPEFMRNTRNSIASYAQSSGVEGYVYDGVDGTQMAYWTCYNDGKSNEHVHEYDEYFVVVAGQYTLIINGQKIPIDLGHEYFLPKGLPHGGEFIAGTRTIHVFGGKRAQRENE